MNNNHDLTYILVSLVQTNDLDTKTVPKTAVAPAIKAVTDRWLKEQWGPSYGFDGTVSEPVFLSSYSDDERTFFVFQTTTAPGQPHGAWIIVAGDAVVGTTA